MSEYDNYDTWTMAELRARCAECGITAGRSKAETITRIRAHNGTLPPAEPVPEIVGVDYGRIEARAMAHMVAGGAQVADIMNAPYGSHAPVTGGFTTEVRADGRRHVTGTYDTPKTKAQRQRDVRRKMRKATRRAQRRSA